MSLATSDIIDIPYPATETAATTLTTETPGDSSNSPPADVTAEVIIIGRSSNASHTPQETSPTGSSHAIPSDIPTTTASPQGVPQGELRVLSKRSEARGLLLGKEGGLGVCSPPTATHYLTVTSTLVTPTVTYATATQYIPNVISQVGLKDVFLDISPSKCFLLQWIMVHVAELW